MAAERKGEMGEEEEEEEEGGGDDEAAGDVTLQSHTLHPEP